MSEYVKNRWVILILWLAVIALIIWVVAGTSNKTEISEIEVAQETYTVESTTEENDAMERQDGETGYFFVKMVENSVKVYWVDESGEHMHRETSIAFDLLSAEDQDLLKRGVTIETEEELAAFLENYDS